MKRRLKGFTLIELLVVIAIIAILAAILFPVFAQARKKARQASCQGNLKQIATAVMQYCYDHDGNGPMMYNYSVPDPGLYVCASPLMHLDGYGAGYWDGAFNPHHSDATYSQRSRPSSLFVCPASGGRWGYYMPWPAGGCYQGHLRSYYGAETWNIDSFPTAANPNDYKLGPADALLVGDSWGDPGMYAFDAVIYGYPQMFQAPASPPYTGTGGPNTVSKNNAAHNGGNNLAYRDGHVKWNEFDSMRGSYVDHGNWWWVAASQP